MAEIAEVGTPTPMYYVRTSILLVITFIPADCRYLFFVFQKLSDPTMVDSLGVWTLTLLLVISMIHVHTFL